MLVRALTAGLLLSTLSTFPASAQEEATPSVDLVATVFIGFADGATVEVMGSDTTTVSQTAPGEFTGMVTPGAFTFTVTEPEDCVFEARFAAGDQVFTAAFDVAKINSIAFAEPAPKSGYTRYKVTLTGSEGAVQLIAADGSRSNAGFTSPIGTSIPQPELDEAAAALLELCHAE